MEKPLLKITFKEPIFIAQHGLSCKANFIIEKEIKSVSQFIVISGIYYPLALIKQIEFIHPNEI